MKKLLRTNGVTGILCALFTACSVSNEEVAISRRKDNQNTNKATEVKIVELPQMNMSFSDNYDMQINLKEDKPLINFPLKKHETSGEALNFGISQKEDSLKYIASYFKTKDISYLRNEISVMPSYSLSPYTLIDTLLMNKELNHISYSGLENQSGQLITSGSIESSDKFYSISDIKYELVFGKELIFSSILKSIEAPIEMTQLSLEQPFDIKINRLNPSYIYEHIIKNNSSIRVNMSDFSFRLEEKGKVYTYREEIKKILKNRLTLQIIDSGGIHYQYLSLKEKRSIKSILKDLYKDAIEFENNSIKTLNGLESTLPITTDIFHLKNSGQGIWMILASNASNNITDMVGVGEVVTIVYVTGEEISKYLYETKVINLPRFTGALSQADHIIVKKNDQISILVEGIGSYGTNIGTVHSSSVRGANGSYFQRYGTLGSSFKNNMDFSKSGVSEFMESLSINLKDKDYKFNKFSIDDGEKFLKHNSVLVDIDINDLGLDGSYFFMNLSTGNKEVSYGRFLNCSTYNGAKCFGSSSFNYIGLGQQESFKTNIYNITIIKKSIY
jgi:predicted DNA-binding transcriptional regulator